MALYVHRRLIVDLEHTKQNKDQHICMSAYMLSWILAERMQAQNLQFWRGMFNIAYVLTPQQHRCEFHLAFFIMCLTYTEPGQV